MSTNFLYAQAPNRKGNHSTKTAEHKAVPSGSGLLSTPKGSQGAPKARDAFGNNNVAAMKQPVKLCKPVGYDGAIHNDGYLKNSSYLK